MTFPPSCFNDSYTRYPNFNNATHLIDVKSHIKDRCKLAAYSIKVSVFCPDDLADRRVLLEEQQYQGPPRQIFQDLLL